MASLVNSSSNVFCRMIFVGQIRVAVFEITDFLNIVWATEACARTRRTLVIGRQLVAKSWAIALWYEMLLAGIGHLRVDVRPIDCSGVRA